MGIIDSNSGEKMTKQAADWVNANLTKSTAEMCANTLFKAIQMTFSAPYDIAMGLIEIIQHKKYSKYIVTTWSIIGALVMLGSLILYLINGSYPFNAWGLGVSIASAVVIFIAKHPIKVKVSSNLAREIEQEIAKVENLPTISPDITVAPDAELGSLYADDDDDDELLDDDDDELLDDDDDELLDDDDDDGIGSDMLDDIYQDILEHQSATDENTDDSDPVVTLEMSPELQQDILDFIK